MQYNIFIEPHADDLLFSAHTIMKKRFGNSVNSNSNHDTRLHVMTISNSSISGELRSSKGYCKEMGYEYIAGENIPQIFFRQGLDLIANAGEAIKTEEWVKTLYLEWFRDIKDCIKRRIQSVLDKIDVKGIYYCYGILHPAHVLTRCAIDEVTQNKQIAKYCVYDIPYCNMELARKLYRYDSLQGKNGITTIPNVKEKRVLLYKYYPTEVYMLDTTSNILQTRECLVELN